MAHQLELAAGRTYELACGGLVVAVQFPPPPGGSAPGEPPAMFLLGAPMPLRVMPPSEAAARLNLPMRNFLRLLREGHYPFTALAPGGQPGDRNPKYRWGLTEAQLAAIVKGQERHFPAPEPEDKSLPFRGYIPPTPDGKTLIRKLKTRGT